MDKILYSQQGGMNMVHYLNGESVYADVLLELANREAS